MAKFYGEIGFSETKETAPGVHQEVLTERPYYGDVIRNVRRLEEGEGLNSDLNVQNTFSIMADAYAYQHFFAMRYIRWMGALWTVTNVEVKSPRLELRVGGLYNGITSETSDNSGGDPGES